MYVFLSVQTKRGATNRTGDGTAENVVGINVNVHLNIHLNIHVEIISIILYQEQ